MRGLAGTTQRPKSTSDLLVQKALSAIRRSEAGLHGLNHRLDYLTDLFVRRFVNTGKSSYFARRANDLYIVTFPKSGTTLIQMLCHQLAHGPDDTFDHILSVSPFLDYIPIERLPLLEDLRAPRLFKTHFSLEMHPQDASRVYVARRLSRVVASAYQHNKYVYGSRETHEDFIRNFINGHAWGGKRGVVVRPVHLRSWFDHIRAALEQRDSPTLLFLRYDDVVKDLESTARQLARFWGIPLKAEQLPQILRNCSKESMRANTLKFDPRCEPWTPWTPSPCPAKDGGWSFLGGTWSFIGGTPAVLEPSEHALLKEAIHRELAQARLPDHIAAEIESQI